MGTRRSSGSSGFREVARGVFAAHLFSADACRELVSSIRQVDTWEAAGVSVLKGKEVERVVSRRQRHANVIYLDQAPPAAEMLRAAFASKVHQTAEVLYASSFTGVSNLQLIQYPPGGKCRLHTDCGPGTEDRMVTVLCYLNDEFSGGATAFPDLDFAYQPRTGDVILFPSEWVHAAEPVRSGEKYVCVGFYLGKSPVNWM